ncbi:MAG: extracellular solute-binding protein [Euzebyales bacterium]|nr:extracellular solute-binding protein [Euzebyales bacterium]
MFFLRRSSVLLVVLALMVAACGGEESASPAGDGEATLDQTDAPADQTDPATEAATAETTAAGTEAAADPTGEATEAVTRTDADLVIWADDTRLRALQPFGDANGVEVAIQELAFDEIRDQTQIAAPAGEGPDIIVGAHDWLGQLVTNGVLAPVEIATPDDYQDVAIRAFTYDARPTAFPTRSRTSR